MLEVSGGCSVGVLPMLATAWLLVACMEAQPPNPARMTCFSSVRARQGRVHPARDDPGQHPACDAQSRACGAVARNDGDQPACAPPWLRRPHASHGGVLRSIARRPRASRTPLKIRRVFERAAGTQLNEQASVNGQSVESATAAVELAQAPRASAIRVPDASEPRRWWRFLPPGDALRSRELHAASAVYGDGVVQL